MGARRVFTLGALLFVGSCFASFEACSSTTPPGDPTGTSSQPQALTSSGDPAGNRGGSGRTGEYIDNYLTSAQVDSGTFKRASTAYVVDGTVYAQPLVVPNVPIT
ncbi:MAG TPA: hypothetical protein VF316_04845, partial [Polyangiaceae bacterium]